MGAASFRPNRRRRIYAVEYLLDRLERIVDLEPVFLFREYHDESRGIF
jgi:hypothetical protein